MNPIYRNTRPTPETVEPAEAPVYAEVFTVTILKPGAAKGAYDNRNFKTRSRRPRRPSGARDGRTW